MHISDIAPRHRCVIILCHTDIVGCADAESCMEICGSASGCSNIAYPTLVLNLMPLGKENKSIQIQIPITILNKPCS